MNIITEGKIICEFDDNWSISKYDNWAFYRNQFQSSCCSNKAVDIVAYDKDARTLWLIELKDYRMIARTKEISLWDEVAIKVRDTLAGIIAASCNAVNEERSTANHLLRATTLRVVLHLEQPRTSSKLFPRPYNPTNVQQKLRQIVRSIDPHPSVVEIGRTEPLGWRAYSP
jgi:hypothetical protein